MWSSNSIQHFLIVPIFFRPKRFNSESQVEHSCHFSLISSVFPWLLWLWHLKDYRPVILWNFRPFGFAISSWFRFTIRVWQEYHRHDGCVFLLYPIRRPTISICPITDTAYLILCLRSSLPAPSTVEVLFFFL